MNTPDTQGTPAPLSGNIALYCVASDSGCGGGCCHGAGGCACCCGGGGTAGGVLLETRVSAGRWGLHPPGNKKKGLLRSAPAAAHHQGEGRPADKAGLANKRQRAEHLRKGH